ncbi:thymocyte selection-associated high mobility group box protein TOX isoform X2 [Eurosta solidaginis]
MDVSTDEYHTANDDSFVNTGYTVTPIKNVQTTTLAARKQLTPTATDGNEPAKPLSAYGLFFRDTVSAIKQQNPNCTFQELSRIVSSMWEALDASHKNVYSKKHETALTEYMKQLRIYKQQQEEQQHQQQQQQVLITNANDSNLNASSAASVALQTRPAVFTISRFNADGNTNQNIINNSNEVVVNTTKTQNNQTTATVNTQSTTPTSNDPSQQLQPGDAGAVQKCTRENCNKRAIINPDWEDEYCSNECVVIHCRNVFNAWVQTNLDARKQ